MSLFEAVLFEPGSCSTAGPAVHVFFFFFVAFFFWSWCRGYVFVIFVGWCGLAWW